VPELSVIIPVYNEKSTVEEILRRVKSVEISKEIIVVDDYSTDGTREILKALQPEDHLHVMYQSQNQGKGAAVRAGLEKAQGKWVIFQDADLEYDPKDYFIMLEPIQDGRADVVYGSRFLGVHRVLLFWNYMANKALTFLTNALYNADLSDMETCYKAFRREILQSFKIRSNRFDIEPEITAKVFKRKYRVYEVPISYAGRDYSEGKKITWRDGLIAFWILIKYRFVD